MWLDRKELLSFYVQVGCASVSQAGSHSDAGTRMNHTPWPPTDSDLSSGDEHRPEHLATLADLAYASGEQALAECYIERLYAHHDRKGAAGAGRG